MIPRLISDFYNSAYIHIPPHTHTYNTNTEKMGWGREKREREIL